MGNQESRHTPDEVKNEKGRWLSLSTAEKKSILSTVDFVLLEDIMTWVDFYHRRVLQARTVRRELYPVNQALCTKVSIWRGDITSLAVDAIVNSAAKPERGGQVNIAILKKAGVFYRDECIINGFKPPGQPMLTGGYKLPAKYVINVLSPRLPEPSVLEQCYTKSLDLSRSQGIRTVAFPCIATRKTMGFKQEQAARIAVKAVRRWLEQFPDAMDRVIFCLYLLSDLDIYKQVMQDYFPVASDNYNATSLANFRISQAVEESSDEETSLDISSDEDHRVGPEYWYATKASDQYVSILDWKKNKTTSNLGSVDIMIRRSISQTGDGTEHFKQISKYYSKARFDFTAKPYVSYADEPGLDFGALLREFFYEGMEHLRSSNICGSPAFEGAEDHKLPCASSVHLNRGVYDIIGKALAHSIMHDGTGLRGLSSAMRFLLTHRVPETEVEHCGLIIDIDEIPHMELTVVLKKPHSALSMTDKGILVDHMDRLGIGLIETTANNMAYICQTICFHEVVRRRWAQIEAIRRRMDVVGLYSFLCDNPTPENIKVVFPLLADLAVDPDALKRKIIWKESYHNQTHGFFFTLIDEIHRGKLEDLTLNTLLRFWTASPYLPVAHLSVVIDPNSTDLPTSATCFMELTVPGGHRNYEHFRRAFQTALTFGACGFGEM